MPAASIRTVPALALAGALACAEPTTASPAPAAAPAPASAPQEAKTAAEARQAPSRAAPRFVPAPASGEVDAIVRAELAHGEGPLLVYVGATWCEPCVAFHEAVTRGALDAALAGVRFLEFDLDRDRERLAQAGYSSRFVPLFVVPSPDGRASERKVEGGIKGQGAVEHIMRRLGPLLAGA
ncbi:MAG TPA: thioredoxin family protein [Nannocystis sp.]